MKIHCAALVCSAMAFAHTAAAGDFYKCKDGAGRISYQDAPCPSGSSEQLDIKLQAPARRNDINYDRITDSERAAQRDIEAAKRLDRERDETRRSADWDRRMQQIDRESDERMDRVRRALNSS